VKHLNIRKSVALISVIGAISALASAAYAGGPGVGVTPLPAGGSPTPVGAPLPVLGGQTQVATETTTFTGLNSHSVTEYTGSLTQTVWKNVSNGFLTFTYQFSEAAGSATSIENMAASDFTGWLVGVGQSASGGTKAATTAQGPLSAVTFNFIGSFKGVTSYLLIISTNAIGYDNLGNVSFNDSGTANVPAYEPVPEPVTLAAFAIMGLGIMLVMLRTRRKPEFNRLA
jgi:hypothetical protein